MLIPVVIVIGAMWLPVALLFLGKGEAKGTGFITGVVGALVLVGSMIHTAVLQGSGCADPAFYAWHVLLRGRLGSLYRAGRPAIRRKCRSGNRSCLNDFHDSLYNRRPGSGRRQAACCPEQIPGTGLCGICGADLYGLAQCIWEVPGQGAGVVPDHLGGRGAVDSRFLADGCR